ncbi:hypothetical protein [Muricoccus roseus]|uniref:hypothetical protein n=1 Tax=Muricoccus roseus TaxID=198092 RepID=UPI0009351A36|nr:hypothetical protein [Roseomonas rosea]
MDLSGGGTLLALAAPLAGRLAAWAVVNPHDPAPLLRPPGWDDAAAVGPVLGVALLSMLLSRRTQRFGLRTMLEARAAEGREPLLGPVTVTLDADRATFRAAAWDASYDAALFTGLEEARDYLVLRFGPARPALLPRRDLTVVEPAAVRDWAAGMLARNRGAA